MSSESFRQKIADLTRKSRQAVKLYSNVAKKPAKCSEEWIKEGLGDIQIDEWKKVNTDLHRELCRVLEYGSQSTIVSSVFELRDFFYTTWRKREADAALLQRDLLMSVESGQFARVVSLGYKLAGLKAQMQALNAAYEELQGILKGYSNTNHTATSGVALYGARPSEVRPAGTLINPNQYNQNQSSVENHHELSAEQMGLTISLEEKQKDATASKKQESALAKIIPLKRKSA